MNGQLTTLGSVPRWLRLWAGGTLLLLFVLLTLGAIVTSFRVGMADPIWPTRPWHLFTINWSEPQSGFLVEHTHRLTGFLVGAVARVGGDDIARGTASFIVRVYGRHAIALKYIMSQREANYPDLPITDQSVETFYLAYTLLGSTGFGAVEWRE
jgi:hypothetical protein